MNLAALRAPVLPLPEGFQCIMERWSRNACVATYISGIPDGLKRKEGGYPAGSVDDWRCDARVPRGFRVEIAHRTRLVSGSDAPRHP